MKIVLLSPCLQLIFKSVILLQLLKGGITMLTTEAPQTAQELYNMILDNPNLNGVFKLVDNTIFWDLNNKISIEIGVDPRDCYFGINRFLFGKITDSITHWHPELNEIYEDVCNIGLKGNVLVIRKNILYTSVLYMGKEEECPYSPNKKWSFGRIYYIKGESNQ